MRASAVGRASPVPREVASDAQSVPSRSAWQWGSPWKRGFSIRLRLSVTGGGYSVYEPAWYGVLRVEQDALS